jgi:hypothetical protein
MLGTIVNSQDAEIKPSPYQVGEIIISGLFEFPFDSFVTQRDADLFSAATITRSDFLNELFLLSVAATMHAVETAGISSDLVNNILKGMTGRLAVSSNKMAAFAHKNIEEAYPYYVEASQQPLTNPEDDLDLSEIELAFGDRLYFYGEESDVRGNACVLLCAVTPKAVWPAQLNGATATLAWSGLVNAQ